MQKSFLFLLMMLSIKAFPQFPKPGVDGYKKTTSGARPACPDVIIKNNRNSFYLAYEGNSYDYDSPQDSIAMLSSIFSDHKFFYNNKYFYSAYHFKYGYIYKVFILPEFAILSVTSKFNDAEFEKCKKMVDNEAMHLVNSKKYIYLDGYKCLDSKTKLPGQLAEMYNEKDTILSVSYASAIKAALAGKYTADNEIDDTKNTSRVSLSICFGDIPYSKTNDSLYIATGKLPNLSVYYYKVYVPEKKYAVSVRSNKNDDAFSQKSKWLLAQIREKRGKDAYRFLRK